MTAEEWRPVPLGPDIAEYEASTLGRIRSVRTGHVLEQTGSKAKTGRLMLSLARLNPPHSTTTRSAALMVWMAFNPEDTWPKSRAIYVGVVNGDQSDVRPSNLKLTRSPGRPRAPRSHRDDNNRR